jgi:hypothetical protein
MASAAGRRDFFISYSHHDRSWAEWIAWQVETAGFTTVLQDWDFRPGEHFIVRMNQALAASDRVLAVLSPDYVASGYTMEEWAAALLDPDRPRLLPVRIAAAELPPLLAGRIYVDLVGLDEEQAILALRSGVNLGRAKPLVVPDFPGATQPTAIPAGGPSFPGPPGGITNLPPRNPSFVGRHELQDRLHHDLVERAQESAVVDYPSRGMLLGLSAGPQVLYGMPGVGKTQIALEYAYRHASDFDIRWLIRAEQESVIASDLAKLAEMLDLPKLADQDQLRRLLWAELARRGRWLLIFDNATEPDRVLSVMPSDFRGRVLITSRMAVSGSMAVRLEVDVFSRRESTELLRARTAGDGQAIDLMAEELGDLPLALEQAVAYMEQTGLTVGEYLDLYRRNREELLNAGKAPTYDATVDATFRLAITQIALESEAAEELLHLCAFLAPDQIPMDLFTGSWERLPSKLAQVVRAEDRRIHMIGALYRYSVAARDANGMRFHIVVQTVARHRLSPKQRSAWAQRAVGLVLAAWPRDSELPEAWPRCSSLLPHALAAVDHAISLVSASPFAGRLLRETATYLTAREQLETAERAAARALAVLETAYGPDHPEVASTLICSSMIRQRLNELDVAAQELDRARAIFEAAYGSGHPEVARALLHLGEVLYLMKGQVLEEYHEHPVKLWNPYTMEPGDYGAYYDPVAQEYASKAEEYVMRALAIFRASYGSDRAEVAHALATLGHILRREHDLIGSQRALKEALKITERVYGPEHSQMAVALNDVGAVSADLDDLVGARKLYEQALAISEALYGPYHSEVALGLANLGGILGRSGDMTGACEHLKRAQSIYREFLSAEHPHYKHMGHLLHRYCP